MRLLGHFVVLAAIGLSSACMRAPDMEEERAALAAADHEWSESLRQDVDTFMSYLTPEATLQLTGLPPLDSPEEIKQELSQRMNSPGELTGNGSNRSLAAITTAASPQDSDRTIRGVSRPRGTAATNAARTPTSTKGRPIAAGQRLMAGPSRLAIARTMSRL